MGLLDFFSKNSLPWQVHVFKPDGSRASSPPQDRTGTMVLIVSIKDAGAKLDRITYDGKPLTQTQLEDLITDAHLLALLTETAKDQGLPVRTVMERGLDKAGSKAVSTKAAHQISELLSIAETDAHEIMLRRLARGSVAIAKQQTP
jgi:hypothetical protein